MNIDKNCKPTNLSTMSKSLGNSIESAFKLNSQNFSRCKQIVSPIEEKNVFFFKCVNVLFSTRYPFLSCILLFNFKNVSKNQFSFGKENCTQFILNCVVFFCLKFTSHKFITSE